MEKQKSKPVSSGNDSVPSSQKSSLPDSDLYLLFPCEQLRESIPYCAPSKTNQEFTQILKDIYQNEYRNPSLSNLTHYYCQTITISIKHDVKFHADVYATVDKSSSYGAIIICLPLPSISPIRIFEYAYADADLQVDDTSLADYLVKHFNLKIMGRPKCCVFSSQIWSTTDILNLFDAEDNPRSKIRSKQLTFCATNNIAQLYSADIYASPIALLEISSNFKKTYQERMYSELLTLIIVELLLIQDAAVKRISFVLNDGFEKEFREGTGIASDNLSMLLEESAKSQLIWNHNYFQYPVSRYLAKDIADAFEVDAAREQIKENEEILTKIVESHKLRKEEIENSAINALLLLLTFVQVFPLIYDFARMNWTHALSIEKLLSYLTSITSCFLLWLIYRTYCQRRINKVNKQKKSKSKRRPHETKQR